MDPIYLDHNASAPLDPEVFEAMRRFWLAAGNPDSRHAVGRSARRALMMATEIVARILGARPDEVVFTSGGTEANNLAVFGLANAAQGPGHIVAGCIEHPAVAEPLGRLETQGFIVDRAAVDSEGLADLDHFTSLAQPQTRFATLILAHNETGAIQPVATLAQRLAAAGIPVHTDAVQAVGRSSLNFHDLGVSTLAASAHKFHGPVGVGVLLVRKGTPLTPHLLGGGQQGARRPGTVPVALAVGLAAALEKWQGDADARLVRWRSLRDRLETGLLTALGPELVVRNGPREESKRLPQTLNVGFPGLDGDALLMQLDLAGVAASLGSACASGSTQPSPSLTAMGVPSDRIRSSVRFSLGAGTTESEIDEVVRRVSIAVHRIASAAGLAPR
jgi:cysteine desulfurase